MFLKQVNGETKEGEGTENIKIINKEQDFLTFISHF